MDDDGKNSEQSPPEYGTEIVTVRSPKEVLKDTRTVKGFFTLNVKRDNTVFATIPAGSDFTIRTNSITRDTIALFPNTEVPGDIIVGVEGKNINDASPHGILSGFINEIYKLKIAGIKKICQETER